MPVKTKIHGGVLGETANEETMTNPRAPPDEVPVGIAEEGILLEHRLLLLHVQLQREASVFEHAFRRLGRPMRRCTRFVAFGSRQAKQMGKNA